jgi:hypothetical protein
LTQVVVSVAVSAPKRPEADSLGAFWLFKDAVLGRVELAAFRY